MTSLTDLLQHGATNAWLFVPTAILLGALHGLEPGHSKTMMAAFIVAIRGTVPQAILLGLSATFSHTLVVWVVALTGLYYGRQFNAETSEPYFQIASAVLILAIAGWMLYRTWREQRQAGSQHGHGHAHDETKRVDTGHGVVEVQVFEDGVPPRFRLYFESNGKPVPPPGDETAVIETVRDDGGRQTFAFADRGAYLESIDEIPEPHQFHATLSVVHGDHAHAYDLSFVEHDHGHPHEHLHEGLDVSTAGFQDAHQLAHAGDIRRRFANRNVTTWQIVMFGLTGGLIPCPAAITVLLLCLQLKAFALGAALVMCFSIGLALTMVAAGTIAALGVRHVSGRWSGFETFARRAPYVSSALIICVGLFVGFQGWSALA